MLKLKKVGITGGIACGKSSVTQFLEELGAYVVSADEVVHHLLSYDPDVIQNVIDLLGEEIVCEGSIDRRKVANIVFKDTELLQALERILHPKVFDEVKKTYQKIEKQGKYSLFVVEVPLLFESPYLPQDFFDEIILVEAPEERCKKWFSQKKGMRGEEYEERKKRLLPLEEKKQQADRIIVNDGSLQDLKQKINSMKEFQIP